MNKKGFTLVELLAAITILSLLALLTVPAVTRPIKDNSKRVYDNQLRTFKDAARVWGAEQMFSNLPSIGNCMLVTLDVLKDEGLVDPNVTDATTGDKYTNTVKDNVVNGILIKIDNQGQDNTNKFVYDVWDCRKSGNKTECYNPDLSKNKVQKYELVAGTCTIFEK